MTLGMAVPYAPKSVYPHITLMCMYMLICVYPCIRFSHIHADDLNILISSYNVPMCPNIPLLFLDSDAQYIF